MLRIFEKMNKISFFFSDGLTECAPEINDCEDYTDVINTIKGSSMHL
jgi:hypothetical protein